MRKTTMVLSIILFLFSTSLAYGEGETGYTELNDILEDVREGCGQELAAYCKGIQPRQGRFLVCLGNAAGKLSPQCEIVFHDAVEKAKEILPAVANVVHACKDDILTHCDGVSFHGNHIFDCLKKNRPELSQECVSALADADWLD